MPRSSSSKNRRRFDRQQIQVASRYIGHVKRKAQELGLVVNKQPFTRDCYWVSGEPSNLAKFRQWVDREYLRGLPHEGGLSEVYK